MIALNLNHWLRERQNRFPTPLICGASVPVTHEAVRPVSVSEKSPGVWENSPFLMTCVGNSSDGKSAWFAAAFHAVDFVKEFPKKMQISPTESCIWEEKVGPLGHDIVLIRVTGLKMPHPSVPVCREASPVGLRGCTISQGERETQNGTPGTGEPVFWDDAGEPGPFGFKKGYNNPVLPRWGEGRVISSSHLQFFAGPHRDDPFAGMNVDNSSAPFITWNPKNVRWELLGVAYSFSASFRTPDGREFWEDSRPGSEGPLVTAMPEGLWLLKGGGHVDRFWADSAVPFVIFNNLAPVADQIEALTGIVTPPPIPSTPTPAPMVTGILEAGALRNEFSGLVGCRITVGTRPVTVTHLGRWNHAVNSQPHLLRLADMSGRDVAAAPVLMDGAAGEFKYAAAAAPATLAPGSVHYLVSEEVAGGDQWMNWNCRVQTSPDIRIDGLAWWDGKWNYAVNPGKNYGPVDLKYIVP